MCEHDTRHRHVSLPAVDLETLRRINSVAPPMLLRKQSPDVKTVARRRDFHEGARVAVQNLERFIRRHSVSEAVVEVDAADSVSEHVAEADAGA